MDDKFKCKLCSKLFNSGRALGGHMKSHLVNLPKYPSKERGKKQEEEGEESYSSLSSSNPTQRRSNRVRKPGRAESADPVSSIEETFSDNDVAMSLMMLSRDDTWHHWVESAESKKHKCEVCDKVFKSTQALGGHRTSHKKAKSNVVESTRALKRVEGKGKKIDKKKIHECPICNKVFGSGQALGGHKRSHFLISPINNVASSSANIGDNWIDLNMPAPMEDDDEMSAVSVAEFIDYC